MVMAQASRRPDLHVLRRMADRIVHRGPDDEGFVVRERAGLGMRRLKIIDLDTGRQPMTGEDGGTWVVFNGEIYNYRELTNRLSATGHVFRTRSDTEAIVHAWEARGADALEEVLRRARHFRQRQPARAVEGHDVGEGAADVDADLHARSPPEGATLPYRPRAWTSRSAVARGRSRFTSGASLTGGTRVATLVRSLSRKRPRRSAMPTIRHVDDVLGYPAPHSPYSHAVVANGFVFVSGQIPVRPGGGPTEVVGDTMQEQTRQALRNVQTILEGAGSALDRVVKVTVLLARPDLYREMNEAYAEFFPGPKPARAMVRFGADIPGVLVAIEAIALA